MQDEEERPTYFTQHASLLNCVAANLNNATGPSVVVITVGRAMGRIEPLTFNLDDARKLVVGVLVALATNDDAFAQNLLDGSFPADANDKYYYPKPDVF